MATPDKIAVITRIQVPLGRREFDERWFYALPSFMRFMEETLPTLGKGVLPDVKQTPKEQMDAVLRKWNAGKPMAYRRSLNNLKPINDATWEMKTADLRIFGWLYRPKVFIAVFAGVADDYKRQGKKPPKESYDDAVERIILNRDRLGLDPPLFVRVYQ